MGRIVGIVEGRLSHGIFEGMVVGRILVTSDDVDKGSEDG